MSKKFSSINYWKTRAGNSGLGSRGALADFKIDFVNKFVQDHDIQKIIDFGSGDLHISPKIKVPEYVGVDIVSRSVPSNVEADKFSLIESNFVDFDRSNKADMVLCMDVLYHIVETEEDYLKEAMKTFVECAEKFIVIYAQDSFRTDLGWESVGHMHNGPWRQFLEELDVELVEQQDKSAYGDGPSSEAVFFVYRKKQ